MEMTAAQEKRNGSHQQELFVYGGVDDVHDHHHTPSQEVESLSPSDRFNEENAVIDILANVDRDAILDEHMVTDREDNLTGTLAGVAGNVLEW